MFLAGHSGRSHYPSKADRTQHSFVLSLSGSLKRVHVTDVYVSTPAHLRRIVLVTTRATGVDVENRRGSSKLRLRIMAADGSGATKVLRRINEHLIRTGLKVRRPPALARARMKRLHRK